MKLQTLILGLMTTSAASVIAVAALADPPERAGRVAYVEGDVSFQPPEADFWTDATRNYPVAAGEAFWTGDSGRTELQIGFLSARLDNETEMDIVDTRYDAMRLAMPQGSASIRLWRDPSEPLSISTPAGDVHLDRAGLYRIDVGAQGDDGSYPPVEVTVFEGEADAPSSEGPAYVDPGEAGLIYAGYDPEMQDAQDASIDDWARDRETREHWRPRPEISESMTGFEDLDRSGDFVSSPQYGTVWFPRQVPADWAPYRYGHWAYVAPWGYTWIDDQPWGFAPFHYGRWAQVEGRWGWIPGRPEAKPVYAPALVAFVGGGGFSVGIGIGGGGAGVQALGWVPLAPDEVYRPPYQVSPAYVRNVNVTNVSTTTINRVVNNTTINNTTINNVAVNNYKNVSAVTVVRADTLSKGGSVQQARVQVTPATLAKARPLARVAALPPPSQAARAGVAHVATAPGQPAAPPKSAPPPPAKLKAVRTAVVAQRPGASKPPVIAGARIAPPQPKPAGAPAKALIAPAQVHNPAAQGKQAVAPPAHPVSAKPRTAPAMPKPATSPPVAPRPMAKAPAPMGPPKAAVAPAAMPKAKAPPPIVAPKAAVAPALKPKAKAPLPTATPRAAIAPAPKPMAKGPAPMTPAKRPPPVAARPKARTAPLAPVVAKAPAAPAPKPRPLARPVVARPAPATSGVKPVIAKPAPPAVGDAQAKARLKAAEDARKRKTAAAAAAKPAP